MLLPGSGARWRNKKLNRLRSALQFCEQHVFDKMLQSDMREKLDGKITIRAHSKKDADDFVYFICTNRLRSNAFAGNVIHFAHQYQMNRLFALCAQRLVDHVALDTFVSTAAVFHRYQIKGNYQRLVDFGRENIAELKTRDDYESLAFSFRCVLTSAIK